MKKNITITIAALIIISVGLTTSAQSGRKIMQMAADRPDGDSRKSIMKMELVNKRGSVRERKMLSYSKDYGKDKKTIMFFEAPADVKGTGFLTWDYNDDSKDDDRWLYLPAMKKTRRISGTSAKKEYFMGSDFTYDDLGNRDIDADTHTLLSEEELNGIPCWVIESIPKNQNEVYSKKRAWVMKENYIGLRVEFYDKQNTLMKELMVDEVQQIDGFWTIVSMKMINHQRNHKTIIRFESMQYDILIDDNLFTVNSLEKGYIN